MKINCTYKVMLVCDSSRVDPHRLSTRATSFKGVLVYLLDLSDDSKNLKVLQGDIGNAFIQAYTKENIFTKCGPTFGDRVVAIVIIELSFYGLTTSAENLRIMLAGFLLTLDFTLSRFDIDSSMRLRDEKNWV